MNFILAALAGIFFWEIFRRLSALEDARSLITLSKSSFAMIQSQEKTDEEKAKESRAFSLKILIGFLRLLLKLVAALVGPGILLLGAALVLGRPFNDLAAETTTFTAIAVSTAVVIVYELVRRGFRKH